jgi:predicted component of type VI protein secretion system
MPDGIAFGLAQDEAVPLALALTLPLRGLIVLALTLLAHG